jgi:hypothetical protein
MIEEQERGQLASEQYAEQADKWEDDREGEVEMSTTSPWILDEDHQKLVGLMNDATKQEHVAKAIRSSMETFADELVDTYTDYLKDEYVLQLEDIVKDRAKRLVEGLLKGDADVAKSFRLTTRTDLHGNVVSYDFEGTRRAIFDTFKAEIVEAEVVGLRKDNEHLRQCLEDEREMRRGY